ncbi:MAG: hypothetical protein JXA28_08400 [Bacteroidetes bacterium]|nr:hypothetical protein [Bacteroidota bacterium]
MITIPEKTDLLNLLRTLDERTLTATETEQLVLFAVRMSETYLRWLSRKRGYQLDQFGLTLEDLAYDVVADLFAGEQEHCCVLVRRAMDNLVETESDEEVLAAFQALLFRNVQQRMARVFAEVHPLFHHLHNALRSYVHRTPDIVGWDMLDGRWYCLHSMEEARLELPGIPIQELRCVVRPPAGSIRSWVAAVLRSVMEHLQTQDTYRRAVLEEDVIRVARDILTAEFKYQSMEYAVMEVSLDIVHIGRVLHAAIEQCRPWLEHYYIAQQRLSERDLGLFLEAIRLYFMDLMNDREVQSAYWYLRQCMPGLTQARFRESYRNKFKYILARILETAQEQLDADEVSLRAR